MQHKSTCQHVNLADLSHLIPGKDWDENSESYKYFSTAGTPNNYILISGSYDQSEDNDFMCCQLGECLSKLSLGVISGFGRAGLMVSNGLSENLNRENRYDPDRIIFYLRRKKRTSETLQPAIGTIKFYGTTPLELRQKMISKVKAVIAIGGRKGTKEEEELATLNHIPFIPLSRSGGAAHEIWETYKQHNYKQSQESEAFDATIFDALDSDDISTAVQASVSLLTAIPELA